MQRRTDRHRWARRSLVYFAGGFLLVQACLLLSLEHHGMEAFDPVFHNRVRLLRLAQQTRPDHSLCLVMGSSRIDMAFFPEILPECIGPDGRKILFFNFCNYGAGPLMQWLMLKRLQQEGVRPNWLILELMPPYLSRENNHFFMSIVLGRELPMVASHIPLWQQAQYALRRRQELLPGHCHELLQRYTGLDLGGPKLLDAPIRLPLGGDAGLVEDVTEKERQKLAARQHAIYRRELSRFAIWPRSDRIIRDIVAMCKQERIDVTFVVSPEGQAFRSLYHPGSDKILADYIATLKQQTGVRIVNARDWLEEGDFSDTHHPTRRGARKYTLRLYNELLRKLGTEQ